MTFCLLMLCFLNSEHLPPVTWPSGRGGSSKPGEGQALGGAALSLALEQVDGDGREGLQA